MAEHEAKIDLYHTTIKVLGTGGAGNNTIHHLSKKGARGIEKVAVNTDAQDLLNTDTDRRILIGRNVTRGLGTGGDPAIGECAVDESREILTSVLEGTDMLFITCGLGGGTGTGSAPIIAELAKNLGILTVAIVTMPFEEEGIIRWENAQIGLEKLRKTGDTIIVLRNDRLMELFPDIPLQEAFRAGDEILTNALVGLSDLVLKEGLINLDFSDVSMVLKDGPNAVIGLGASNSENRMEEAANRAITHPMVEVDVHGAQSALIHISGGPEMTLREARQVLKLVTEKLDPNARIIWGATIDKNLKQTIRVMLILSGFEEKKREMTETAVHEMAEDYTIAEEKEGQFGDGDQILDNGRTIFDIKESILASGAKVTTRTKPVKPVTQATQVFYKIFEEEVTGDLKRFDRAVHFLRENPQNRRALLDAIQACKLVHASSQMFGFDEIGQLLSSVEEILVCVQSREIQLTSKILDSMTLAMEMVVDLVDNRSDGRGETGYIVDRLRELKEG